MKKTFAVPALVSSLLIAACHPAATEKPSASPAAAPSASAVSAKGVRPPALGPSTASAPAGIDSQAMDWTADPCQDFFQFSCGGFVARTEIPGDHSTWYLYSNTDEENQLLLNKILQQLSHSEGPQKTPYAKQLGDFYVTCMDEKKLEESVPELQRHLARIRSIKDLQGVMGEVISEQVMGVPTLFSFGSQQDFGDATQVVAGFDQGGMGLPDREYYLDGDPRKKEVRALYVQHLGEQLKLLGSAPEAAQKSAEEVLQLETELARASQDKVARRDPKNLFHRLTLKDLARSSPTFPWSHLLDALHIPRSTNLNVGYPPFFVALDGTLKKEPLSTWQTYLTLRTLATLTPALPKRFQEESFRYFSKAFTGAKEDRPRWKKCVSMADGQLGEALAQPFVAETFGGSSKTTSREMVAAVEGAFESDVRALSWMDETTKARALEKLHQVNNKVGYPDSWKSYEGLKTDRTSFMGNWVRSLEYESKRDARKIGKPVNRSEWDMTPPTINAYYNPSLNEIVLPAGILRPPLFSQAFAAAVNYGATGASTVGHELTHGFDDEGRQYDGLGNLRDWWTPASGKSFEERAACVARQFDGYVAIDDVHLNGKLTTGENVADLGGLKLGYSALEQYLGAHPEARGAGQRLTPEQAFFVSYGQSWCAKVRPEQIRLRAATDPHAPPMWRVNGPVSNLKSFQKAFQCRAGDKMVSQSPCEVW